VPRSIAAPAHMENIIIIIIIYSEKILVDIISHFFHMKYTQFSLSVFCPVTYTSNEGTQCGKSSVVGVVACYGLDIFGFDKRLGRDFFTRPDRLWGPHSLL